MSLKNTPGGCCCDITGPWIFYASNRHWNQNYLSNTVYLDTSINTDACDSETNCPSHLLPGDDRVQFPVSGREADDDLEENLGVIEASWRHPSIDTIEQSFFIRSNNIDHPDTGGQDPTDFDVLGQSDNLLASFPWIPLPESDREPNPGSSILLKANTLSTSEEQDVIEASDSDDIDVPEDIDIVTYKAGFTQRALRDIAQTDIVDGIGRNISYRLRIVGAPKEVKKIAVIETWENVAGPFVTIIDFESDSSNSSGQVEDLGVLVDPNDPSKGNWKQFTGDVNFVGTPFEHDIIRVNIEIRLYSHAAEPFDPESGDDPDDPKFHNRYEGQEHDGLYLKTVDIESTFGSLGDVVELNMVNDWKNSSVRVNFPRVTTTYSGGANARSYSGDVADPSQPPPTSPAGGYYFILDGSVLDVGGIPKAVVFEIPDNTPRPRINEYNLVVGSPLAMTEIFTGEPGFPMQIGSGSGILGMASTDGLPGNGLSPSGGRNEFTGVGPGGLYHMTASGGGGWDDSVGMILKFPGSEVVAIGNARGATQIDYPKLGSPNELWHEYSHVDFGLSGYYEFRTDPFNNLNKLGVKGYNYWSGFSNSDEIPRIHGFVAHGAPDVWSVIAPKVRYFPPNAPLTFGQENNPATFDDGSGSVEYDPQPVESPYAEIKWSESYTDTVQFCRGPAQVVAHSITMDLAPLTVSAFQPRPESYPEMSFDYTVELLQGSSNAIFTVSHTQTRLQQYDMGSAAVNHFASDIAPYKFQHEMYGRQAPNKLKNCYGQLLMGDGNADTEVMCLTYTKIDFDTITGADPWGFPISGAASAAYNPSLPHNQEPAQAIKEVRHYVSVVAGGVEIPSSRAYVFTTGAATQHAIAPAVGPNGSKIWVQRLYHRTHDPEGDMELPLAELPSSDPNVGPWTAELNIIDKNGTHRKLRTTNFPSFPVLSGFTPRILGTSSEFLYITAFPLWDWLLIDEDQSNWPGFYGLDWIISYDLKIQVPFSHVVHRRYDDPTTYMRGTAAANGKGSRLHRGPRLPSDSFFDYPANTVSHDAISNLDEFDFAHGREQYQEMLADGELPSMDPEISVSRVSDEHVFPAGFFGSSQAAALTAQGGSFYSDSIAESIRKSAGVFNPHEEQPITEDQPV